MEQKLSDTLVKAIDRSNPFMQNLQLASRFNKLIDEGGADLEDDKEATIDVSAYTDPVEIEPTAGKGGMKKATVTLTNIPIGGVIEANKEVSITENGTVEIEPTEGKDGMAKVTATVNVSVRCVLRCYKMTTGTPSSSYPEYIYASKVYGDGSLDGESYYKGIPLADFSFSDTENYSGSDDEISSDLENFTYTRYSAGDIAVTATN